MSEAPGANADLSARVAVPPRSGRARLIDGPVGRTLIALALPMVAGLFAVIGFNLADTYFVARLGTRPLAAMGFTFPARPRSCRGRSARATNIGSAPSPPAPSPSPWYSP